MVAIVALARFLPVRAPAARAVAGAVVACISVIGARSTRAQDLRVELSPAGDRITIAATQVTRGTLLDLLRTRYGIEVRPHADREGHVSMNVLGIPLDSAIAEIMPPRTRYIVRFGDRDIERPALTGAEKRGPPERRAAGVRPKEESPLVRPSGPGFKDDPERVREGPIRTGPGLKPSPDSLVVVTPGRGPKAPLQSNRVADSTLRVSFTIRAPDTIRVVRTVRIAGAPADSTFVRGPFLFALRGAGRQLVYFSSFADPLEVHSYLAEGPHDETRAREGVFAISIPGRFATAARLGALTLEFYDARRVALPVTLDARTFGVAARRSRLLSRVSGSALLTAPSVGPRE